MGSNTALTTAQKEMAQYLAAANTNTYDDYSAFKSNASQAVLKNIDSSSIKYNEDGTWTGTTLKGNDATGFIDVNGIPHYTIYGSDALSNLQDYYNTGSGLYSIGGTNYEYSPKQETTSSSSLEYSPSYFNDYTNQIYDNTPEYEQTEWDLLKDELAKAVLGMNYTDWTSSEDYQELLARYTQGGNTAMKDTLGQVAANTGGLASSYAQTVAQQQYNDYMSNLESAAREMYENERTDALSNVALAEEFADSDYSKYLDQLAQYNNSQGYAWNLLDAAIQQSNYENEWNNYLAEQSYEKLLTQADNLAQYGDFSGYKSLNYSDDQISNMTSAYQTALANSTSTSSTSKANSSSSSKKASNTTYTYAQAKAEAQDGNFSDSVESVIKEYNNGKLPSWYTQLKNEASEETYNSVKKQAQVYRATTGYTAAKEYLLDQLDDGNITEKQFNNIVTALAL